jgi:ribosomal protein S12 methylthiotransferase
MSQFVNPLSASELAAAGVTRTESVHFVSLGCPKNLVDSEVMLGDLMKNRYTSVDDPEAADVIVVNTCSFIASATQESVDTILEMSEHKKNGKCSTLIVTGCLAQRHAHELEKELPEVDYFLGTGEYQNLTKVLSERPAQRAFVGIPHYIHDENTPKILSKAPYTAYLKISEGCRHRCSFCIIPTLRGDLRSRTIESIVHEAQQLAERGVVELNLVSQDSNSFGYDRVGGIGRRTELGKLLKQLGKVDGIRWIRLLYMYPLGFPEELMDVIAEEPKVVKYVDMPLQHITTGMLRQMNRGVGGDKVRNLVRKLRTRIPGLTLRTTFIVGFPGETDADFQALKDFVEEIRFERMGVFTYSPEQGTPAADLESQVAEKVKRARQRELMAIQKKISKAYYKSLVGTVQDVLVEGESDETDLLLQGRMATQAPDIDGRVLINSGNAQIGSIVKVKMTRALDYDVIGEIVEEEGVAWQSSIAV